MGDEILILTETIEIFMPRFRNTSFFCMRHFRRDFRRMLSVSITRRIT